MALLSFIGIVKFNIVLVSLNVIAILGQAAL
jgi:hypothetical protein